MRYRLLIVLGVLLCASTVFGSASRGGALGVRTNDARKHFPLAADQTWQLTAPGNPRFDASGLAFWRGKLLTVNDRDGGLYEIALETNHIAQLKATTLLPHNRLTQAAFKPASRYDIEGVTVDSDGNIYVSEESQRSIFKINTADASVTRLTIDWSPVRQFFGKDSNASFEGVAIDPANIFVANERDAARILVVNRASLKVVDSFAVDSASFAFGGPHYSDLSYWGGRLFVLDRNHRVIFEVDPSTRGVLAEYNFSQMELAEPVAYRTVYPTGTMEGLAVDEKFFWLVTDNNGYGRIKYPKDARPTLFRCPRPKS